MSNAIIYPGTFDPITNGHIDLVMRASKIFGEIIIAVAKDTSKKTLLSFEERIILVEKVLSDFNSKSKSKSKLKSYSKIKVMGFQGLLVNFARKQKINLILRGVRAIADFEFERQLSSMNQHLAPEIETVFMTPAEKYAHISSSFVKDIARLGGDVSQFVPKNIVSGLKKYGFNDYR